MKHHDFHDYPLPHKPAHSISEQYAYNDTYKRAIRRDPCAYCGKPGGTVDHIFAKGSKRKGVKAGPDNWTGACHQCNWSKKRRDPLEFLLSRRKKRKAGRAV